MKSIVGKLPAGISIAGVLYRAFEMTPVKSMATLFEVEEQVEATRGMKFNGALMTHQILRVGEDVKDGKLAGKVSDVPITIEMVEDLDPTDYWALRKAQLRLDKEGKG